MVVRNPVHAASLTKSANSRALLVSLFSLRRASLPISATSCLSNSLRKRVSCCSSVVALMHCCCKVPAACGVRRNILGERFMPRPPASPALGGLPSRALDRAGQVNRVRVFCRCGMR